MNNNPKKIDLEGEDTLEDFENENNTTIYPLNEIRIEKKALLFLSSKDNTKNAKNCN